MKEITNQVVFVPLFAKLKLTATENCCIKRIHLKAIFRCNVVKYDLNRIDRYIYIHMPLFCHLTFATYFFKKAKNMLMHIHYQKIRHQSQIQSKVI